MAELRGDPNVTGRMAEILDVLGRAPRTAENLNRAQLRLINKQDSTTDPFDMTGRVDAVAEGRQYTPRTQQGNPTARVARTNSGGTASTSAAPATVAAPPSPDAAPSRGPTTPAAPGSAAQVATVNRTGSLGDLDLLGTGTPDPITKPEGDKATIASIAGADVDVSTEGGPGKGTQTSALGAEEAKRAALTPLPAGPGEFNGQATPELIAQLQAADQPLPYTMSPVDYAAAGGAGAGLGLLRRQAPSLVGALSRAIGRGNGTPTAEQALAPRPPTGPTAEQASAARPPAPAPAPSRPTAEQASAPLPPNATPPRVPGAEAANAARPPGVFPIPPGRPSVTPTAEQAMAARPPTAGPAREAVLPPRNPTLAEATAPLPPARPTMAQANAANPPSPAVLRVVERLLKSNKGMSRAEAMERATETVARAGARG